MDFISVLFVMITSRALGTLRLLLGLLLLQHLLHNLLLLNEERANNPLLHALRAAGTTVCTSNRLLVLSNALVLHWAHVGSPWRAVPQSPHLMEADFLATLCRVRTPPGVFTLRTP